MAVLATVFAAAALWALWRSALAFRESVRRYPEADGALSPLVRGLRNLAVGVSAAALSAGVAFGQGWVFPVAAVFLCQEVFETALLGRIVRMGRSGRPGTVHGPATKRMVPPRPPASQARPSRPSRNV